MAITPAIVIALILRSTGETQFGLNLDCALKQNSNTGGISSEYQDTQRDSDPQAENTQLNIRISEMTSLYGEKFYWISLAANGEHIGSGFKASPRKVQVSVGESGYSLVWKERQTRRRGNANSGETFLTVKMADPDQRLDFGSTQLGEDEFRANVSINPIIAPSMPPHFVKSLTNATCKIKNADPI
ncbi:MAG: hypothetical protein IPL83_07005 [Bdellovibrionales bacterium]|nr:hypothetical protein [Bdellovibrionales bacterium]